VGVENQDGWTALGWANARNQVVIAEMLKNAGARQTLTEALIGLTGGRDAAPPSGIR
jgi:hypothetical protein